MASAVPSGPRQGLSFRDALAGSSSSLQPRKVNFEIGKFLDVPALFISDDDMVSLASPFALTLVGKFGTVRPPLDAIRIFVRRLNFLGDVKVDLHDDFNVFFRFAVEKDYIRFFLHRFYRVFGVWMKVIKWSPFFDFLDEIPIVPLWISFPEVRLQMLDKTALMFLGRLFGKPLTVDYSSAGRGVLSHARVLVEVDVSKPIPNRVWIGSKESGAFQAVSVENIPPYCLRCRRFGHEGPLCPMGRALIIFPGVLEGSDPLSNPPGEGGVGGPSAASCVGVVEDCSSEAGVAIDSNDNVLLVVSPPPAFVLKGPVGSVGVELVIPPNVSCPPMVSPLGPVGGSPPFPLPVGSIGLTEGPGVMVVPPLPVIPLVLEVVEKGSGADCDKESVVSLVMEDCLAGRHVPSSGDEGMPSPPCSQGFPVMGITTRSMVKACGGPPPTGKISGSSGGGKSKKKKRENKYDHAMAIALQALFKPPDYNG